LAAAVFFLSVFFGARAGIASPCKGSNHIDLQGF